jgi:hypothetical protein
MNFERGVDVKGSIGVGLASKARTIRGIYLVEIKEPAINLMANSSILPQELPGVMPNFKLLETDEALHILEGMTEGDVDLKQFYFGALVEQPNVSKYEHYNNCKNFENKFIKFRGGLFLIKPFDEKRAIERELALRKIKRNLDKSLKNLPWIKPFKDEF